MPSQKPARRKAERRGTGFTNAERAAMRERARETRSRPRGAAPDGESEVREKIAAMGGADRAIAERLHAIIRATAPTLVPKTWYGMPAYAKDDQIVCYFRPAEKFKERYATLGFSDEANLDEGHLWPCSYALTALSAAEEATIVALLKRAIE